jgi:hypothetical protein
VYDNSGANYDDNEIPEMDFDRSKETPVFLTRTATIRRETPDPTPRYFLHAEDRGIKDILTNLHMLKPSFIRYKTTEAYKRFKQMMKSYEILTNVVYKMPIVDGDRERH